MSDQTLDPSYDNILSRLSKLELFAASGGVVATVQPTNTVPAPKQSAKPLRQASHDATANETATENVTKKALRGWNEIAERTVGDDGFLLSFLKMAKAYVSSDKKLLVVFPNELAMDMVNGADIKGTLCSVANVETQRAFTSNDVIYQVAAASEGAMDTDLDDFE